MRDARLNLILLLIAISISGALSAAPPAVDSIPEIPICTPVDIVDDIIVAEVDSIVPVAPEFSRWGTSMSADSIATVEDTNRNWWYLFKKGKLKMDDPTVRWPKFLGFCVKVYNWGDRVFSSTDPEYVVGTGKKWRARIINDNWANSYYMKINPQFNSVMSTPFHVLLGASLQYMAVSYTYSLDLTHMITGSPINYKKQEFGFNCARFSADGYYYSSEGCNIRTFGDYKGYLREPFSGVDMVAFGGDAYYFFNGYKYSQGAAYNFSKIQKKSQGCLMAGIAYCNQNIAFDFLKLPIDLVPYLKFEDLYYKFHYNDYNLLIGYGYNCVISPHWLYNITVIPGLGFNHCYEDSEAGSAKLLSVSGRAMTSFTFNSGNWFAGLQGRMRGHWYQSKRISLFNAVESIVLSGGIRF
ncbi:MAG: DUF4421 domain-containing protein [Muribaculaceae bacterium]|nr:DUF4421 domain-containing protein [Muribaculaceae bacterium]